MIGHCSGGRQTFLTAISLPLEAAVDCYGGFVVESPPEGHPLHGAPPLVDRAGDLSCPLLGLFGAEDQHPSPEHVAELENALKAHGKTYEFHSYEGAGHAFLQVDRSRKRSGDAAPGGWPHPAPDGSTLGSGDDSCDAVSVTSPRSVLVVDDQAPFRSAARAVLRRLEGFEFAGEASSGPEAIELVGGCTRPSC